MLQQYALAPGVAKSHMQAVDSTIMHDIRSHSLEPLSPARYLVCVENLNSGKSATKYVLDLSKWYVGFLALEVFDGVDTISDAGFIELTPPAGVFSVSTWARQGVSYRISVCYASSNYSSDDITDQVNVYVRSPAVQTTYEGVVEKCTTTAIRRRELMQHACARLVETHGFRKMPNAAAPVDADINAQLAKLVISHGASIATSNNSERYTFHGQFDTNNREGTVGSVVLPMVLRHLSSLQEVVGDTTSTPYALFAVNPFAYALLLPDVGGWTVCVQVNMLARVDAVIQMFALQKVADGLIYSRVQSKDALANLWTAREYEGAIHHTRAAVEAEYARVHAPSTIGVIDDRAAQALPKPAFLLYLAHVGLGILYRKALKRQVYITNLQGRSDAQFTTRVLLMASSPIDITSSVDMRVKVVRCALQVLYGNLRRWMREVGNESAPNMRKQLVAQLMEPASARYDMWPAVDKFLYETIANAMVKTEPSRWSYHLIKLMELMGTDVATSEQRLARLLFFTPVVFPLIPAHMRYGCCLRVCMLACILLACVCVFACLRACVFACILLACVLRVCVHIVGVD